MSSVRTRGLRSEFIAISFFLSFSFSSLDANLLVILLQRGKILTCFAELAFLHTLTNIPMDKGALRVHQIELVVNTREHLSNRSGVADHANSAHDLGKVTTWHDSWWLVVDATFKPCRGPVHKLNGTLRLDSSHACVDILGHHIPTPC